MKNVRFGTIDFLNAKPIFYGVAINNGSSGVDLHSSEPWQATGLLLNRDIDLGILPSIEYTHTEELSIVPGISISSKGSVGSVKLFCAKPLQEVKTIAVDRRSRTSVCLLRILCAEFYKIKPRFKEMDPDIDTMLNSADAALIIGDKALYVDKQYEDERDLSEDWYKHTGYPFVFAFLAGWPDVIKAEHISLLNHSLEQGLANVQKIAENHPGPCIESAAELNEKYLTQNISYDFGDNELNGLKLFYIKAWENGLIDGVPRLNFFDTTD